MTYTLVKITMGYEEYLEALYASRPEMRTASYAGQQAFVFGDAFGEADNLERHLTRLGVEAHTVIANCAPMQDAWAREHGLDPRTVDILEAQLREYRPTVLFIHNCFRHDDAFIRRIRAQVPSVRLVVGWCGIGFNDEWTRRWTEFDAILTCNPTQHADLLAAGIPSEVVLHGFEEGNLAKLDAVAPGEDFDLLFTGSMIASNDYHRGRIRILEALVDEGLPLRIFSKPLPDPAVFPAKLLERIEPPLYGLRMLAALRRAKVVFNSHLDGNGEYAGNSRLFEATGVGTCLLTDQKRNIAELFEPDREIVTFSGAEDCARKARRLLQDDALRRSIAQAGQKRTLANYTYADRARAIHEFITGSLRAKQPRRVAGREGYIA
ncbi:glycosyltransferase [uncultured Pseudodesulfovibrio sp.]|uniref:CgeB family protein n=1 Tax=uncultured Pseudodesulfovibrio sp. TaxID=2035858 RepID=UPI0029C6F8C9|nr:glycosyltransferase [uncultured Pseudodesulfovibrio sp.]